MNIIQFESDESMNQEDSDCDVKLKMKVQLKFFGSIRAAAAKDEEEVYIHADSTVYELLQFLSRFYGNDFKGEIFSSNEGSLRDDLTISINGVIMEHLSIKTMKIIDSDIIALLPTFPGGG